MSSTVRDEPGAHRDDMPVPMPVLVGTKEAHRLHQVQVWRAWKEKRQKAAPKL